MFDEFDEDKRSRSRRRPPVWQIVVLAIGAGLLVIGAAAGIVNHDRTSHANRLAVKYGLAGSTKNVSLTARCTAALRSEYDASSASSKAVLSRGGMAVLAPRICALAVQEGLVRSDGTMTRTDAKQATASAIQRMGQARLQTLIFGELAVTRYHLASRGHATRWDRCVAMGYSAYDGQTPEAKSDFPPRARFFRAVRTMCTRGIARGLVPASGAPSGKNTSKLLREALGTI